MKITINVQDWEKESSKDIILHKVPEGCSSFTFPQLMGHSLATQVWFVIGIKFGIMPKNRYLELRSNYYSIQVLLLGGILTAEEGKRIGLVTEVIKGSCSMFII